MALKKFLDQQGVSYLWSKINEQLTTRDTAIGEAKAAAKAADDKAVAAKGEVDALELVVGTLPEGETSVVSYINKKTEGIATDAALGTLQATVTQLGNDVDAIEADYLKAADKTELEGKIKTNTDAITVLNGNAETVGSVAHTATGIANTVAAAKVAEIVAGADADFDTLKEIADWILNDTTGAADMANDIKALQDMMVGVDTTVVAEIAAEIDKALKSEGADKYALASELTALAGRVKTLEDAGYQNAEQVGSAIDAKITALDLANTYDAKGAAATAETNAKKHADDLIAGLDADVSSTVPEAGKGIQVQVVEVDGKITEVKVSGDYSKVYDVNGAAAQALADAKTYVGEQIALIPDNEALSNTEIDQAIAKAQA